MRSVKAHRLLAIASAELRTVRNQASTWLIWLAVLGTRHAVAAYLAWDYCLAHIHDAAGDDFGWAASVWLGCT